MMKKNMNHTLFTFQVANLCLSVWDAQCPSVQETVSYFCPSHLSLTHSLTDSLGNTTIHIFIVFIDVAAQGGGDQMEGGGGHEQEGGG